MVITQGYLKQVSFLIWLAGTTKEQHIIDWASFWRDTWDREFEQPKQDVKKFIPQSLFPEFI